MRKSSIILVIPSPQHWTSGASKLMVSGKHLRPRDRLVSRQCFGPFLDATENGVLTPPHLNTDEFMPGPHTPRTRNSFVTAIVMNVIHLVEEIYSRDEDELRVRLGDGGQARSKKVGVHGNHAVLVCSHLRDAHRHPSANYRGASPIRQHPPLYDPPMTRGLSLR